MTAFGGGLAARQSGILLHPTSLPGPWGMGDLGPQARAFLGWLAAADQSIWQMLPLGPVDGYGSPYASPSAFAANPLLLSLDDLIGEGLLDGQHPNLSLLAEVGRSSGPVDFVAQHELKMPLLLDAARRLVDRGDPELDAYKRMHSGWLPGWTEFAAGSAGNSVEHEALQFLFDRQWGGLRREAKACGVQLWGDLPLYVSLDSADVQQHPSLFRLDPAGRPEVVSGVPPDAFCLQGQRWGHPMYRWAVHEEDDFGWWRARFRRVLQWFDRVRVDHFGGLARAWAVEPSSEGASEGCWEGVPGDALLRSLHREHGTLPLFAEDLGPNRSEAVALREAFGLEGVAVLQFGWDGGADNPNHPKNVASGVVLYPGTHDNDTSVGWYRDASEAQLSALTAWLGTPVTEPAWTLIELSAELPASTCIVAMQDVLQLGSEDRMNRPGTLGGNWSWRMAPDSFGPTLAERLKDLNRRTGRTRPSSTPAGSCGPLPS